MKYWFFAALLANVVFLLWEFHYGAFDQAESSNAFPENEEKQILTVSEAAGSLTPSTALEPQALTTAENLAGLQEPQPTQPENPHVPPAGGETATPSTQSEIASQAAIPAEVPEVSANAAPKEKETAGVTASPIISEAIDTSSQMPETQTEPAESKRDGEAAVPSESATPQTAPPAAAEENSTDGAAQQAPAVPEAEAPKPEVLKTECYTAGPVEDAVALETLLKRYRPQLNALEFSATEKRKNNTYLVYHPAAATLEQSVATAEMLRSNYGISDLLVFREGALKGMISLGVFSNEQRAKTAQSQFEAKGVHAEIRPRFPLEVHYSVRMSWNEQQAETAQELTGALKSRYRARRVASACK